MIVANRLKRIGTIVAAISLSTGTILFSAESSLAFITPQKKNGWSSVLPKTNYAHTLWKNEGNLLNIQSLLSMSVNEDTSPKIIERSLTATPPNSSNGGSEVSNSDEPPRRRPLGPPPRRPEIRNNPRGPPRGPNRGPPRGPPRGPGGNRNFSSGRTGTVLKLQNPMKLQRISQAPPDRPPRPQNSNNNNDDRGRRPTPRAGGPQMDRKAGGDNSINTASNGPASTNTRGKGAFKKGKEKKEKENPYDKKRGRTQLRVGSGKKQNAASLMRRRGSLKKRDRSGEKEMKAEAALERRTIHLPEGPLTVAQLSEILDEKPGIIIKFLMTDLGIMAGMTQTIDTSTSIAVCEGLGKVVADADDFEELEEEEEEDTVLDAGFAFDEDDPEDLEPRAPVVTIMGHVDHGKTSLLDAIRDTRVTAGEAGGITQHIGAYQVLHEGEPITFIDTPGHAAFSDMRSRGANITDIVILVVASDDGVKQQTVDSILCARQAGVPLIVAVNKCDLPTADVAKVKGELAGYDLVTEDLGGDILFSEISAKERINLDDLLSKVMLQAELQELKANPNREAQGVVVEAKVEKGLGAVATTLIQKGTLRVGDCFVAGESSGKVKALIGSDGKTRYDEAPPSMPIKVVGFNVLPAAGDTLVVAETEQLARELAASRQRIAREKEAASYQDGLMASVSAAFSGGVQKEKREMCVVVKADVQGSAEALARSFDELKLENDEAIVSVKVLVAEAGDVTKSDIAIASVTPDTTVIAFNCAANMAAMDDARIMGVPIGYYSIVYDAIDSVESRMQEVLSPTPEGEYVGAAKVQEVFNIGGTGNIAGSKCTDGIIRKGSNVRVMRGDKILCESKVRTLRNFKAEVDQIETGDECGVGLLDYEDFQPGDVIESYVEQKK